jgi:hypothetical protein
VRQEMKRARQLVGAVGGHSYTARCRQTGWRQTTQRERSRTSPVLRFLWKRDNPAYGRNE